VRERAREPLLGEGGPFVFAPLPAKVCEEVLHCLASLTPVLVFGASGERGLSQMFKGKEDGASTPQRSNDGAT